MEGHRPHLGHKAKALILGFFAKPVSEALCVPRPWRASCSLVAGTSWITPTSSRRCWN
jgi:hypothetical protein